jgi:hypothetical protein
MKYSVCRSGVEIGEFEEEDFISRVNAQELGPHDWYWHEGMTEWKRIDDLLSEVHFNRTFDAMAKEVEQEKASEVEWEIVEDQKKDSAAKSFWLVVGGFFAWIAFMVVALFLITWGIKLIAFLIPWYSVGVAISLVTIFPISLLLLIFKKTREWGGLGLYITSQFWGLYIWMVCVLYAVAISYFWTFVGVCFMGVGVIPVAFVQMLFHRDWETAITLVVECLIIGVVKGISKKITGITGDEPDY